MLTRANGSRYAYDKGTGKLKKMHNAVKTNEGDEGDEGDKGDGVLSDVPISASKLKMASVDKRRTRFSERVKERNGKGKCFLLQSQYLCALLSGVNQVLPRPR